eukprot:scpid95966/ scgid25848/ 
MSLLLFGSECWTPLQRDLQRLSVFHTRCVRSILGVSRSQCWRDHISNVQLLELWGDPEPLNIKVANRRLEWLGDVVRMESERIPRQVLFGTILACHPAHGPRRRWKDCAVSDLKSRDVYGSWYATARESRAGWRSAYTSTDVDASSSHSVLRGAAAAVNCAVIVL